MPSLADIPAEILELKDAQSALDWIKSQPLDKLTAGSLFSLYLKATEAPTLPHHWRQLDDLPE